ncbi:molybdopterin-dependent oxidoreductase [Ruegeria pomeroyi]|nr:molybdopterin-dependent oxidoreductase [Ruegeria pomeroyi]MCE8526981.1 molybdopterin-dependent oxidoreductase [Ruegeria pomeroyi]MCE8530532.1 molybdopterin-dependent oxidoreductase [Ruegeria pomeroyi]MCE8544488.1 molybdopterin-dependent oxidoreductase [Ruegeria pomeroyi]
MRRLAIALSLLVGTLLAPVGHVANAGEELLVISASDGSVTRLDLGDLKALPVSEIRTRTIWTTGVQEFRGVALRDLLDHVGAASGMITAVALNDYLIQIPTSDATIPGPIVAYLHNGKQMSVREKGPLWVVYPYDDNPVYNTEEYYARSIWQLIRLEVPR